MAFGDPLRKETILGVFYEMFMEENIFRAFEKYFYINNTFVFLNLINYPKDIELTFDLLKHLFSLVERGGRRLSS